jgi:hypothetical protein
MQHTAERRIKQIRSIVFIFIISVAKIPQIISPSKRFDEPPPSLPQETGQ